MCDHCPFRVANNGGETAKSDAQSLTCFRFLRASGQLRWLWRGHFVLSSRVLPLSHETGLPPDIEDVALSKTRRTLTSAGDAQRVRYGNRPFIEGAADNGTDQIGMLVAGDRQLADVVKRRHSPRGDHR